MALSEFMPYGAPDLIEGGPARLARATWFAAGFVALAVLAAGSLMPRHVPVAIDVAPLPPPIDLSDFRALSPPEASSPARSAESPERAVPVVRPDALVVQRPDVEPAAPPVGPAGGPGAGPDATGPARTGEAQAAGPPRPDDYIYRDVEPALLLKVQAFYPDLAREAGVEGTVRLLVLVGLDGHVEQVVVRPGGSVPLLDETAISAAKRSRYRPALANGHPVRVWVSQDYRFTLH